MSLPSSALPSPPDSPYPDSASVSSLPSVSSSFFFSSAAASPRARSRALTEHSESEHDDEHDPEQGLIIPSLTLPPRLRRPTPFGQTLGELRLLVLGSQGAGKSFLTGLLLEDNEDVVDVGSWEDAYPGELGCAAKVLHASTDWLEFRDRHGLERYEPMRNVEITELPGYHEGEDPNELIETIKSIIEAPFRQLSTVIHPDHRLSGMLASLLAAPTTPLYTALIFLSPSPPNEMDRILLSSLSLLIPTIVLPASSPYTHAYPHVHPHIPTHPHTPIDPHTHPHTPTHTTTPKLSSFKPYSAVELRNGLFHSPETIALLRGEAVDRFLRWREVEKSVGEIGGEGKGIEVDKDKSGKRGRRRGRGRGRRDVERERERQRQMKMRAEEDSEEDEDSEPTSPQDEFKKWTKAKWEEEWMESHSYHVAIARKRKNTIVPSTAHSHSHQGFTCTADAPFDQCTATFDPLHLPSLLLFSLSLLRPLRWRVGYEVRRFFMMGRNVEDDEEGDEDGSGSERRNERGWYNVQVALVGGFCVGMGVGLCVRSS